MGDKLRVDVALVERGLASSREKAQALIMAGQVYSREVKILKPSQQVGPQDELHVKGALHPYVSRGALKLEKALKVFQLSVHDQTALDIGAATGGFTDVLLRNGASHVYAVDVGYGQLDWAIRNDDRVTVMERTNARYLTPEQLLRDIPTLTVMDVSFISVRLILPVAAKLMNHQGVFCILIKPQFEAGREQVGKKGVVRDPKVHEKVLEDILTFAPGFGYRLTQLDFSPITGPEGNIEYIALLEPSSHNSAGFSHADIPLVVEAAHEALRRPSVE